MEALVTLRPAAEIDLAFWTALDGHIQPQVLRQKLAAGTCRLILHQQTPVGVLRWNLFWDQIPFLTMIILQEAWRSQGIGGAALDAWEGAMRAKGHALVMTSTQADERAQFFYRRRGYRDSGCLVMPHPPFCQPLEILMTKPL